MHMIPAYSPQARGRSERNFSTWQGRLPQELRLRGIRTLEGANKFLNEHYIAEFNRRFTVPAAQRGTAFISCRHRNLEMIFKMCIRDRFSFCTVVSDAMSCDRERQGSVEMLMDDHLAPCQGGAPLSWLDPVSYTHLSMVA